MGWIKERILSERRKHNHNGIDWARLAEAKIKLQIISMIKECPDKDYVGEFLIKKFEEDSQIHKETKEEYNVDFCGDGE